jgi:hypothetical protein
MIGASNSENSGVTLPDDPPNFVIVQAKRRATALARCVYIYRCHSIWLMTTDLSEPPTDAVVWMFPANQNDPARQNRGGCQT